MTPQLTTAAARAQAAYHAASDHYDDPALGFWDKFGRATVTRLGLRPGARVLDVCCGSGASALPAAEAVGPDGWVLGVDLAPGLIDLARAKARRRGLAQAEFRTGDFEDLAEDGASFDAVVCVFGIFFLPDMPEAVRRLWRFVRPGGQLAITTWGPRVFEPANSIFWDAIRAVRPELYKGFNPWDRISEPAAVAAMMGQGGVQATSVTAESNWHPLAAAEDWWSIVLGSGYRGVIEQLTPEERERVRTMVLAVVRNWDVRLIETNVVYALARKA
jgi:ubiquinone/menaquinone biosynthesis C-methylase UbiE